MVTKWAGRLLGGRGINQPFHQARRSWMEENRAGCPAFTPYLCVPVQCPGHEEIQDLLSDLLPAPNQAQMKAWESLGVGVRAHRDICSFFATMLCFSCRANLFTSSKTFSCFCLHLSGGTGSTLAPKERSRDPTWPI